MLDELASSRQLRESAEMRLSESRARLNGLTQAVQDVLADADQMAAHLAQQAMARANMDTERLLAATRHRLQQEEDALSRHLQASLIQDVVQQARALLAEQLTAEDQAKTVTQFMDALPALQKSAASPQTNGSRLPVLSGADAGGPASDPVNAGTAVGRGG
jgi:F0F1-type ATP synthase membrane subunit b/b'